MRQLAGGDAPSQRRVPTWATVAAGPLQRMATAVAGAARQRLAVAAASLLASACSLLPTAAVDDVTLHVLEARPAVATASRGDRVLAVSPVRAAPGAESTAMAYVQKAHALDHYATHRWADTPARMLDPLLVRALEDSGGFRAVVQTRSGVPSDLRLDAEIVRLRQVFLGPRSHVELGLRLQLIDVAGRRVLATRYLEVAEPAPSDDAAGGVAAANAAVGHALVQVAAFCVESASMPGPRTAPPAPARAASVP